MDRKRNDSESKERLVKILSLTLTSFPFCHLLMLFDVIVTRFLRLYDSSVTLCESHIHSLNCKTTCFVCFWYSGGSIIFS